MPAPSTGRDLHVDVPLSQFVINRRPDGFIADRLVPITPVAKQTDMYYRFRHHEHRRYEPGLTLRAPGTQARKVHMTVTSDNYRVKNYALGAELTIEDEVNADQILAWRESQSIMLTDRLMTDYEYRVAELAVASASVFEVRTVSTAWSVSTGGRPYNDLLDAKERFRRFTGKTPNRLIIPAITLPGIQTNEQLRSIILGSDGGVITPEQIAKLIGIDEVLVPMSLVNTFSEDATIAGSGSYADIWGPHIWMTHVTLLEGREVDTWLQAFRWTSPQLGEAMAVEVFPYDPKRKKTELAVSYYQDEKVVSPDLAMRIMNVVSVNN